MESKFPVDMHIYIICPWQLQKFTKFCWVVSENLRWPTVLRSTSSFGPICKFKKGVTLTKKWNQNFRWICTSTWFVLHNYKVLQNSVEWLQRSWDDKFSVVSLILAKFKLKNVSSKRELFREQKGIKISCGYAYLNIMSFITTMFLEILLSGFRGVALTRKTVVSFILAKFLSSKRV